MKVECRQLIDNDAYRDILSHAAVDTGDKAVQNQGIECSNNAFHFRIIGNKKITWMSGIRHLQVKIVPAKNPIGFLGGQA